MSHKKILLMVVIISIVAFLISYYLFLPCNPAENFICTGKYSESIAQPLSLNSLALLIISIILLFFSQEIFKTWKKFAVWFIPIAVVLTAITPTSCGQLMCFDRELITWFTSVGFLVISLLIIIYKKIKLTMKS